MQLYHSSSFLLPFNPFLLFVLLLGLRPLISFSKVRVDLTGKFYKVIDLLPCFRKSSNLASSSQFPLLLPRPCEFGVVLLLALPSSLCLISVSFCLPLCLDILRRLACTTGQCPINSDNNDPLFPFYWAGSKCGSSEFSRTASANVSMFSLSQTQAACFLSVPTSRITKERIPA